MYSDIEDDNLDDLKAKYASKSHIGDIDNKIDDKHKTISDLINAIEVKREKEKEEKKANDIQPAMMSDYFTGFSSTITNKVEKPKQIKSVLEENLDKLNDISVINQVSKHEIQSRIGRSDNYVECFPTMEDTIKGFDETNFAQKVKEKYYDEDVIQKDQEWMNSKRTKFAFSSKVGDDKQKKRDAKFKNKVNRETAEVNAFISKKD